MKYKVPVQLNPHMKNMDANMMVLGAYAAASKGLLPIYTKTIFAAIWAQARSLASKEELVLIFGAGAMELSRQRLLGSDELANAQIDNGIASYALDVLDEMDDFAPAHEAMLANAVKEGVFGAPSLVVEGKLFFGNDRLDFLEHELAK
jgi:2-hydroxychromene-2-carboxylate isomerase